MSKLHKIGAKVEYRLNSKWLKGVVHSIRSYEDPQTRKQTAMSYLVDTGKDDRIDEITYDERTVEIDKRVNAAIEKDSVAELEPEERSEATQKIIDRVNAQKSLPKSNVVTEQFRQPELVEVEASDIR